MKVVAALMNRTMALTGTAVLTAGFMSVVLAPTASAGPLCDHMTAYPAIYQKCLVSEANQALCGNASGCVEGDPCIVGSAIEQAVCNDQRLAGLRP